MSLTAREAFKFGFLQNCVERGLSLAEIKQLAKTAAFALDDVAKPLATMGATATPYLLAAPWLAGAAGGWGLSQLTDIDDTDVAGVQTQERISEYLRQAARLNRERQVRDARHGAQQRPVRPFP